MSPPATPHSSWRTEIRHVTLLIKRQLQRLQEEQRQVLSLAQQRGVDVLAVLPFWFLRVLRVLRLAIAFPHGRRNDGCRRAEGERRYNS